jgi:uncharacterized protein YgiM (DUF1202 family)
MPPPAVVPPVIPPVASTLYTVTQGAVNVRKGAGTTFRIARTAYKGDVVDVPHFEKVVNGYVALADGNWIFAAYLDKKR